MVEIADAVLTLSTDDGPLQAGLAQAETSIRDSLARMEAVLRDGALNTGEEQVALAQAATALVVLTISMAGIPPAATTASISLTNLSRAASDFGAAATVAATQARLAALTITAAFARVLASARAALAALNAAAAARGAAAPGPATSTGVVPPLAARALPPGRAAAAARPPLGPLVGTLNVTVDREHPRAIQAGVERALIELAERAELAGALD